MLAAAPHGANPGLYDGKLPYDTLCDFTPIVRATVSPVGFFVPASSPHRTLRELADAARAQRSKLFAGSPGNGSGPHRVIELWNWKTGAKFEHLPMKGDAPLASCSRRPRYARRSSRTAPSCLAARPSSSARSSLPRSRSGRRSRVRQA